MQEKETSKQTKKKNEGKYELMRAIEKEKGKEEKVKKKKEEGKQSKTLNKQTK